MPSSDPLVCPCCTLSQAKQYCQRCLQSGLATHAHALSTLQSQLAASTQRSAQLLDGESGLERWRIIRATLAEKTRAVKELKEQIQHRERDVAAAQSRIDAFKTALPSRQRNLRTVTHINPVQTLEAKLVHTAARQADITQRLIHARTVLVNEVIDVFGVRQRSDGRAWEIAKLELPPIGSFKNHPSSEINAALMHTLHLLSLLTSYLSISLPFEPTAPPPLNLPHVGRPLMKANTPFLGTTRWREKWVLWMSSTASALATPAHKRQSLADLSIFEQQTQPSLAKTWAKHRHFLTAFALLSHSVAYLAWTQGVEGIGLAHAHAGISSTPPIDDDDEDGLPESGAGTPGVSLIPPTDILHLLQLIALSPNLGKRAHAGQLRHMGFGLDVAKVVRSVLEAEGAQGGEADVGEGWDLLERE